MYQVKTDKFEGPLELLLELIEKEKMDITELSLSSVADEYLEYLRNNQNIKLENLAEFLAVASKLVLIKSRALLPMLQFSEEEEKEIKDLTYQLEEYKKFKEASIKLNEIVLAKKTCYSRESLNLLKPVFYPPEKFHKDDLKKYFLQVLAEIPVKEELSEEVVEEVVTLEERINDLEEKLRGLTSTSFEKIVSTAKNKVDVIVSFLAMLEMIKQKIIKVDQNSLFQEIRLRMSTEKE